MTDSGAITALFEERSIEKTMLQFGWALDVQDWECYRACLTERVMIDFEEAMGFPEVQVSADDWTQLAEIRQTGVKAHHAYSNFHARIVGDMATAVTYFVARHWRAGGGRIEEFHEYGWYECAFVRAKAAERWLIERIKVTIQHSEGDPDVLNNGGRVLDEQLAQVWPGHKMTNRPIFASQDGAQKPTGGA